MNVDVLENETPKRLDRFSGKKVLVTGASGFIGSHLCRRLCRDGVEVNAISRAKHFHNADGLRWWQGDLSEMATVRSLLTAIKPDVIFHLAGYPMGARELDHVMPSFRRNLMCTVNVLTAAAEIGCRRIVLTGSLEEPAEGNPQVVPGSPYAVAKWAGSAYARMFHTLYHLPVVILRVFMVYGPAQQDCGKLIPYVILSLLREEAPKLSNGQRKVDWVYVEDVVEAFLAAAQAAGVEGTTIDVGSGALIPIRTVVESLVRLTNAQIKPLFGALPDRPFEQVRVANTARSNAMIGWKPAMPLEKGLQCTVDWYRRQLKNSSRIVQSRIERKRRKSQ